MNRNLTRQDIIDCVESLKHPIGVGADKTFVVYCNDVYAAVSVMEEYLRLTEPKPQPPEPRIKLWVPE